MIIHVLAELGSVFFVQDMLLEKQDAYQNSVGSGGGEGGSGNLKGCVGNLLIDIHADSDSYICMILTIVGQQHTSFLI